MSRYYNGSGYTKITGGSLPKGSSTITFGCWVKSSDVTVRQFPVARGVYPNWVAFEIRGGTPSQFAGYFGTSAYLGGPNLVNDTWYHVAVSAAGGGGTLFVNGVNYGGGFTGGLSTIDDPLILGAGNDALFAPLTGEIEGLFGQVNGGGGYADPFVAHAYAGLPVLKYIDGAGARPTTWMPLVEDFTDYRWNDGVLVHDDSVVGSSSPFRARGLARAGWAKPRRGTPATPDFASLVHHRIGFRQVTDHVGLAEIRFVLQDGTEYPLNLSTLTSSVAWNNIGGAASPPSGVARLGDANINTSGAWYAPGGAAWVYVNVQLPSALKVAAVDVALRTNIDGNFGTPDGFRYYDSTGDDGATWVLKKETLSHFPYRTGYVRRHLY